MIQVKRSETGRWGVYRGAELVEGGFFSRAAAEEAALELRHERFEASREEAINVEGIE